MCKIGQFRQLVGRTLEFAGVAWLTVGSVVKKNGRELR